MASSTKRSRSPTPEDNKDKEEPDRKKQQLDLKAEPEIDDSEETLALLKQWNVPARPPANVVDPGLVGASSKPIKMQLTKENVEEEEEDKEDSKKSKLVLSLSKSKLASGFEVFINGKEWKVVSVYGPDRKVYEMKMWIDEKNDKIDLKKGWSKFVEDYDLKKYCDFVSVWMFWNMEKHTVSLAIDGVGVEVIKKQLSKRISKAVFDDED